MVAGPGFQKAFPVQLFKQPIASTALGAFLKDPANEPAVERKAEHKIDQLTGNKRPRPTFNVAEIDAQCAKSARTESPVPNLGSGSPAGSPRSAGSGFRQCEVESCFKSAQGRTARCKAHGGGKRCISPECRKSAQGSTDYCKAHGGGKRCKTDGCTKAARGSTDHCIAHGGGKRCVIDGCSKSAVGSTAHCVKHGGGRRCSIEECTKSARGGSTFCAKHGTMERKRLAAAQRAENPLACLGTAANISSAFGGAPSLLNSADLFQALKPAQQQQQHSAQPPAFGPFDSHSLLAASSTMQAGSQSLAPAAILAAANLAAELVEQQRQQRQQQQQQQQQQLQKQLLDLLAKVSAPQQQQQQQQQGDLSLPSLASALALLQQRQH